MAEFETAVEATATALANRDARPSAPGDEPPEPSSMLPKGGDAALLVAVGLGMIALAAIATFIVFWRQRAA